LLLLLLLSALSSRGREATKPYMEEEIKGEGERRANIDD